MISLLLLAALTGDVSVTIHGFGITNHGLRISEYSRTQMTRKITSNASFLWNPEFGITLKTKYWQNTALYINDCFGNHAGTFLTGPKYQFFNYFSVGGVVGIYAREAPGDSNDMPLVTNVNGIELIPMAAATASVKIPITKKLSIETNIMSNGYLSHGNLGLRIDF